jgi:hypothetical protein
VWRWQQNGPPATCNFCHCDLLHPIKHDSSWIVPTNFFVVVRKKSFVQLSISSIYDDYNNLVYGPLNKGFSCQQCFTYMYIGSILGEWVEGGYHFYCICNAQFPPKKWGRGSQFWGQGRGQLPCTPPTPGVPLYTCKSYDIHMHECKELKKSLMFLITWQFLNLFLKRKHEQDWNCIQSLPARIQDFYLHTKPTGQIVSRIRLPAYGRAEIWSDKTGTRLPAYGRTRLGHDCQPMAGQDCWPMAKQDCQAWLFAELWPD